MIFDFVKNVCFMLEIIRLSVQIRVYILGTLLQINYNGLDTEDALKRHNEFRTD
jgi:hypothetical protein